MSYSVVEHEKGFIISEHSVVEHAKGFIISEPGF